MTCAQLAVCYHILVFCLVFLCLGLSVFSTIPAHEEEAADLPGLDTLYNTGDIVACAVVSVTQ